MLDVAIVGVPIMRIVQLFFTSQQHYVKIIFVE